MSSLKNKWNADITNDPDDDFNLYIELLEGEDQESEEYRGRITRNANDDLILTIYPSDSSVEIPLDWLLSIVAGAEKDLLRKDDPANNPTMMDGYGVVSARKIGEEDLRRLVGQKEGGRWPADLGYGIVEVGESQIYVHLVVLTSSYSPEEQATLKKILGDDPVSGVQVDYAPDDESKRWAKGFCDEIIKEFGGYFVRDVKEVISSSAMS
jgi:hypothetical protein